MKKFNFLLILLAVVALSNVTAQDPHQENVAEMDILITSAGADFAFDGVREESIFTGDPTTMDTVCLLSGTLPEGYSGQFWIAIDDVNIYGYAEITDPDLHAKDEVGITYDFSDPASFTQYGWEGDPVADDDGAVYTKVEYGAHANVETENRGTTYLLKDKPGGYTVEWKTAIYTGVTADADIVAAMLERGTFMFDIQLAACTYDGDGAFVDRAYLAWNADDNNTWQSSFNTGILTMTSSTSIDRNLIEKGYVYPNPVSGVLYIKGDVSGVEFFSITGKLVKRLEGPVDGSLDVSDLANGIYLLSIKESTGNIKTVKLVKE